MFELCKRTNEHFRLLFKDPALQRRSIVRPLYTRVSRTTLVKAHSRELHKSEMAADRCASYRDVHDGVVFAIDTAARPLAPTAIC